MGRITPYIMENWNIFETTNQIFITQLYLVI